MHQGHVTNDTPSEDVTAPLLSWATPLLFLGLTIGAAQVTAQLQAEASWRVVGCAGLGSVFCLLIGICGGGTIGIFVHSLFTPLPHEKRSQIFGATTFAAVVISVIGYQAATQLLADLLGWRLPYFGAWCGLQALVAAIGIWRWRHGGGEIDVHAPNQSYSDAGTWVKHGRLAIMVLCSTSVAFAGLELWRTPESAGLASSLLFFGIGLSVYVHQNLKRLGRRAHIDVQVVGNPAQLQVVGGSVGTVVINRHDIAWIQHRTWNNMQGPHESRRTYHYLEVLCHDGSVLTLQNSNANWAYQVGLNSKRFSDRLGVPHRSLFSTKAEWSGTPNHASISEVAQRTQSELSEGPLNISCQDGETTLSHQPKLTAAGRSELWSKPLTQSLVWACIISGLGVWLPTKYDAVLSHQFWLVAQTVISAGLYWRIAVHRRKLIAPLGWRLTTEGLHKGEASSKVLIQSKDIAQVQIHADLPDRTGYLQVRGKQTRVTLFNIEGDLITTPFAALWAARAALLHQLSSKNNETN